MSIDDPQDKQLPTLAQKIDRLFRTVLRDDGGEYTYRQVEDGIRTLAGKRNDPDGGTMSASYVCQLRLGRRTNPTLRQIALLAAFFEVDVGYFVGPPDLVTRIDVEISLVRALLRDPQVRAIATQASSLTPAGVRAAAEMIASLQAIPGMVHPPRPAAERPVVRRRRATRSGTEDPAPTQLPSANS